MKALREFDIHIFKLSNGEHNYQFEISDSFFELFENEIFSKGNLLADVSLQKSSSMIQMNFHVEGKLELTCDRSLDLFDHSLSFDSRMHFKYGDEEKELSEDVMVITKDCQTINVADLLFEFIGLETPMKKLHPRYEDEEDNDEELIVVYTSQDDDTDEQEKEEEVDPRWAALKNLKNNK
ncbi:YceD family protein [Roseivirga sp.]|uniref:YceD family protein n=1 Tax=Roseivirga sp. TaxID=1964215 RepID=UPI003B8E1020